MKIKYAEPVLKALKTEKTAGQYPCWNGSVAYGGQCGNGGTAGTSCVTGSWPFAS